ncbi:alpha/beta fold hydrolase [Kitasatospora sp. NPDC056800]|uniref:alpha/beta fold hydrolase n=1 Tax=Kitasatospora sp. NPDC056800 TaxID=3345948 RepID=UPI0036B6ABCD
MTTADRTRPQLVFVHGIGRPLDPGRALAEWKRALAKGARAAGFASEVSALVMDWSADSAFAHYGDLFSPHEAQGAGVAAASDDEQAQLLIDLLGEFLDSANDLREFRGDPRFARVRAQVRPSGEAQGVGAVARRLAAVVAAVAAVPGLRWGAQQLSAARLLSVLSQPGRYLRRAEPDADGRTLDRRIRDRVLEHLDPARPAIVVAHSLGSVVALEALAEYSGPVRLFITIGSPLAVRGLVRQRLVPQPPTTPESVAAWADFWDDDDLVVPPRLPADVVRPNAAGVRPVSTPLTSATLWSHDATRYLQHPDVARAVMEALTARTPA